MLVWLAERRCTVKEQLRISFSPPAFQASLQTSTVQVRHRKTGVAVMLIKKSDVKAHFAARIGKSLLHKNPVSHPAENGSSSVETGKLGPRLVVPGEDAVE